MKSPAWLAGYKAGSEAHRWGAVSEIVVPSQHASSYGDFTSGWLVGARDAADQDLIEELSFDLP